MSSETHSETDRVNEISNIVIGAAIEVHKELGPGLLESVYEACLFHELVSSGIKVERQIDLPILFKGTKIDAGYRIDLLVEKRVILELKAVESLLPLHTAQLLSYLKLSNLRLGLLLNFNTIQMRNGVKRIVNGL